MIKRKQKYIILNAEDDILTVFLNRYLPNNDIIICAQLNDGSGKIYCTINYFLLRKYFNSEITLSTLINESDCLNVLFVHKKDEVSSFENISTISDKLQCGDQFFTDIPEGMKMTDIQISKMMNRII